MNVGYILGFIYCVNVNIINYLKWATLLIGHGSHQKRNGDTGHPLDEDSPDDASCRRFHSWSSWEKGVWTGAGVADVGAVSVRCCAVSVGAKFKSTVIDVTKIYSKVCFNILRFGSKTIQVRDFSKVSLELDRKILDRIFFYWIAPWINDGCSKLFLQLRFLGWLKPTLRTSKNSFKIVVKLISFGWWILWCLPMSSIIESFSNN